MSKPGSSAKFVSGSYRDPAGRVCDVDGKIFRTITKHGADAYTVLTGSEFIKALVQDQRLVPFNEVPIEALKQSEEIEGVTNVLEHDRLEFISYPYEWSFSGLKRAALCHLDIQIDALEEDIALIDASAYNIQFIGPRPIFIDHLSFRPYVDGALWEGHRQFCEQFLNPLLFQASLGVPFNDWYRGCMSGVTGAEISSLLPLRSYFDFNVMTHIHLPRFFEKRHRERSSSHSSDTIKTGKLPKHAFSAMLKGLRKWIASLESKISGTTEWVQYATSNTYSANEAEIKQKFVADFCSKVRPNMLWDLGCNTGLYSSIALNNGAHLVIGFDSDAATVDEAFQRAQSEDINFLPLYQNLANPSADQGWGQSERMGLIARRSADAVLSLALVHHLTIGNNIPLDDAISWIVTCAPQGVIEFVPRTDPMVKRMLSHRRDIFEDYSEDVFLKAISSRARIVRNDPISDNGRLLVWYDREN